MFDFYLPLEEYFVKILLENKVRNWEAKLFWINIEHLNHFKQKSLRQQMYNALRVLTTNDFLSVEYSPYNGRIFLYNETLKLVKFREEVLTVKYKNLILHEKSIINNELEQFELQKKYIEELYLKYPELAPQYFKLKNEIGFNIKYCNEKIKLIDSLKSLM